MYNKTEGKKSKKKSSIMKRQNQAYDVNSQSEDSRLNNSKKKMHL